MSPRGPFGTDARRRRHSLLAGLGVAILGYQAWTWRDVRVIAFADDAMAFEAAIAKAGFASPARPGPDFKANPFACDRTYAPAVRIRIGPYHLAYVDSPLSGGVVSACPMY